MRSSFLGFEVSKRSIQISQKALDITSNNLSNRKTEGYTRQRVDLNSTYLSTSGKYSTKLAKLSLSGQGVNAFGVSQVRDPYIDKRYREYAAIVAENDVKHGIVGDVEKVLDDIDNTGLVKGLEDLKAALNNYAGDSPDSKELSSVVRNEAYSICQILNGYSTQLNNLLTENRTALETSVSDVNTLIDKITQYNGVITGEYNITAADLIYKGESVSASYGPNELIDDRNVLIDELSNYGNINVTQNSNGSVSISMGGTTIINDTKNEHITMKDYDSYGAAVLKFTNGENVDLESGDIKAYTDMLNGNGSYASYYQNNEYGIPYYISTLDAFASSFAKLMNETNGATETDTTRAMFATDEDVYNDDGTVNRAIVTAANIRISDEWMADSTMIGQNKNADTGEWTLGLDGTNVNKLLLAMDKDITVGRTGEFTGSIYDYCLFVDNRFAESASFYKDQYDLASANATALLDERSAVSGVSETEEGINMLSYQKWFNASSRMMTTMDDCLDRIINNMGRVGL